MSLDSSPSLDQKGFFSSLLSGVPSILSPKRPNRSQTEKTAALQTPPTQRFPFTPGPVSRGQLPKIGFTPWLDRSLRSNQDDYRSFLEFLKDYLPHPEPTIFGVIGHLFPTTGSYLKALTTLDRLGIVKIVKIFVMDKFYSSHPDNFELLQKNVPKIDMTRLPPPLPGQYRENFVHTLDTVLAPKILQCANEHELKTGQRPGIVMLNDGARRFSPKVMAQFNGYRMIGSEQTTSGARIITKEEGAAYRTISVATSAGKRLEDRQVGETNTTRLDQALLKQPSNERIVGFVGLGRIGEATLDAWIKNGFLDQGFTFCYCDPNKPLSSIENPSVSRNLTQLLSNLDVLREADLIVLNTGENTFAELNIDKILMARKKNLRMVHAGSEQQDVLEFLFKYHQFIEWDDPIQNLYRDIVIRLKNGVKITLEYGGFPVTFEALAAIGFLGISSMLKIIPSLTKKGYKVFYYDREDRTSLLSKQGLAIQSLASMKALIKKADIIVVSSDDEIVQALENIGLEDVVNGHKRFVSLNTHLNIFRRIMLKYHSRISEYSRTKQKNDASYPFEYIFDQWKATFERGTLSTTVLTGLREPYPDREPTKETLIANTRYLLFLAALQCMHELYENPDKSDTDRNVLHRDLIPLDEKLQKWGNKRWLKFLEEKDPQELNTAKEQSRRFGLLSPSPRRQNTSFSAQQRLVFSPPRASSSASTSSASSGIFAEMKTPARSNTPCNDARTSNVYATPQSLSRQPHANSQPNSATSWPSFYCLQSTSEREEMLNTLRGQLDIDLARIQSNVASQPHYQYDTLRKRLDKIFGIS